MATEIIPDQPLMVLPADLEPDVEHLVTEDDTPVDSIFSEKQQRLLTEPLYSCWAGPGEGRGFIAMANVGLFYAIHKPPFVPDALLSVDVERLPNLREKRYRSYFVWQYGKPPDVVIEVVSNGEGGEDTQKLSGYARVKVSYYVIFDPEEFLGKGVLRTYKLDGLAFRTLDEPIDFPQVGLGLRLWQGKYEGDEATWLRWVDPRGQLVPTGREQIEENERRIQEEQRRADEEQRRADEEQRRADRLAEELRRLGGDPDTLRS